MTVCKNIRYLLTPLYSLNEKRHFEVKNDHFLIYLTTQVETASLQTLEYDNDRTLNILNHCLFKLLNIFLLATLMTYL